MDTMYLLVAAIFALSLTSVESNLEPRIVGGKKAKISDFPFFVSIRTYPNKYICGGAIIDDFWVATAAQCVRGVSPNNLFVVAGVAALNETGDRYAVQAVQIHPWFNPTMKTNDTALLKLTRKLSGKNIKKIEMTKEAIKDGKDMELCGHGATGYPFKNASINLMAIELKSIANDQCSTLHNRPITNYNLCTKGKSAKGACVGDVGSPLIVRGGIFGTTKLHGIVSWGTSPCAQGKPDVYSSIAAIRPWIRTVCGC
uniref:Peptidase S1 domain-containing protein n=1 Tax=Photinus pyralis TaxID=7054 RepID=A0A1Y1LWN7_PHOPY